MGTCDPFEMTCILDLDGSLMHHCERDFIFLVLLRTLQGFHLGR